LKVREGTESQVSAFDAALSAMLEVNVPLTQFRHGVIVIEN
jgi:hypothetical protein